MTRTVKEIRHSGPSRAAILAQIDFEIRGKHLRAVRTRGDERLMHRRNRE